MKQRASAFLNRIFPQINFFINCYEKNTQYDARDVLTALPCFPSKAQ